MAADRLGGRISFGFWMALRGREGLLLTGFGATFPSRLERRWMMAGREERSDDGRSDDRPANQEARSGAEAQCYGRDKHRAANR